MTGSIFTTRKPRPKEGRARFYIYRLTPQPNGRRKAKRIDSEALDRVNAQYVAGDISFEKAEQLAEDIRQRVAAKHEGRRKKPLTASVNLDLLKRYWHREYEHRDVVDHGSMASSMNRALTAIGNLSLLTAEQWELQKRVMTADLTTANKRRVIARLNTLLRFAGRDFKLQPPKPEYLQPKYLTEAELLAVVALVPPMIRDAALVSFATGARLGELFTIRRISVNKARLDFQIRRDGKRAPPKNRKRRATIVLEVGHEALTRWLDTPEADRIAARNLPYAAAIKAACRELFKDKAKHVTFHDLRHSYAIAMLGRGVSLSDVAKLLGDSVQVTEMYYTGFAMVDEHIDALIDSLE